MKILEVAKQAQTLTDGRPYAVIGGLAQILWARKSHTDDVDVAVAAPVCVSVRSLRACGPDLVRAYQRVRARKARGWRLPKPPDEAYEADIVFEVYHLLFRGSVVGLIAFRDEALMTEILATARAVPELGGLRFIRPELLLVTQLLRPGAIAALAAVELVLARRAKGDFEIEYARYWAHAVDRGSTFERTLARAADLERP
jgi:hypothetical protein